MIDPAMNAGPRLWPAVGLSYRKTVTWHPDTRVTRSVTSPAHRTMEAADKDAWELAIEHGYTKPKWWQWWRWGERN